VSCAVASSSRGGKGMSTSQLDIALVANSITKNFEQVDGRRPECARIGLMPADVRHRLPGRPLLQRKQDLADRKWYGRLPPC